MMAGAAVFALFIPGRYTHFLKNPIQIIAPMQWLVHGTTARAQQTVKSQIRPTVSAEQFELSERDRQALENQLAASQTQIEELRQQLAGLAGWRARGLPPSVQVISARVVAQDSVGWRESILVDRGLKDGVTAGDWVASHGFLPSKGQGERAGLELVQSECLLGRVTETTPYTSRVVLLTDTDPQKRQRMVVRVARVEEGHLAGPSDDFVLYGLGGMRMSVPGVPSQLVETGQIRKDDLVIASPNESRLPLSMVVGQVERIEPDRKNPLVVHLFITPRMEMSSVQRVYVIGATRKES